MTYQEQLIKEYTNKGFLVLKTIRLSKNGYPDLMILKEGKTTWIESKEANDTLKPLQKKRIDELRALGFDAFCLKKGKGKIY